MVYDVSVIILNQEWPHRFEEVPSLLHQETGQKT